MRTTSATILRMLDERIAEYSKAIEKPGNHDIVDVLKYRRTEAMAVRRAIRNMVRTNG